MTKTAAAAQDWYDQAARYIKEQHFDRAKECLERSLASEETARAHHDLGIIHYMHDRNAEAVSALQQAARLDPDYDQAYANLSRIMHESGDEAKAIEYSVLAMSAKPAERSYKEEFVQLVKMKNFALFYPQLKNIVTECLETEGLFHEGLTYPWHSLLITDPSFARALKLEDHEALLDPFFIAGLRRLQIFELEFENFIRAIRRAFMNGEITGERYKPLLAALAIYCHFTDYIMEPDDQPQVDALRARIEGGDFGAASLYACYEPLAALKNASEIGAALNTDPAMAELVRAQIDEPLEEREIRKTIKALTPIDDEISRQVQEQYEIHPYPRWKSLNKASTIHFFTQAAPLSPEILIAGCGTGQEIINYAQAMPGAKFLAVDLSRVSLSYAIRKAKEYGVTNVEFGQADILALDTLGRRFDCVISSGALQCLEDPVKGWKVLTDVLKPGGLMRIAVYSEIARRDIVAARQAIADHNYPSTNEGMRAFRKDFPKLMNKKNTRGFVESKDFYAMPACRDLLFHVKEWRFTVPQIEGILGKLGLEFVKFDLQEQSMTLFRKANPRDPEGKILANWNKFEKANPDTFAAQYEFWSRKI